MAVFPPSVPLDVAIGVERIFSRGLIMDFSRFAKKIGKKKC